MIHLIRREFIVNVPLQIAWRHLTRVEQWPSWSRHIKRLELSPPGELTERSSVRVYLTNGVKGTMQMTEFHPPYSWRWDGPFLWFNSYVDHRFEAVDDHHTKLIWIMGCEGFGASLIGRFLLAIYNQKWSKAIPLLIAEMNSAVANSSASK